jgi:hypothetical protein
MPCDKINIPDCDNISADKINQINVFIKNVLDAQNETPEKTPEENVNVDKQESSQNEAMPGEDEEDGLSEYQKEVNRRYRRVVKHAEKQEAWDKRSLIGKLKGIARGENNPVSGELKKNLFWKSSSNGGKSKRIRRKFSRRKRSKKTRKGRSRKHKK